MLKDTTSTECKYCSAECGDDRVELNNQVYCCYGCATLDDVVGKIETRPEDVKIKYKQFDHPEVRSKILDFENDKIYKLSVSLLAIHCASCVELLEDLPNFNPKVKRTQVNFEARTCTVWADKDLELSILAQLLENVGYPPQVNFNLKAKVSEKKEQRKLLFKMAFAGFCFGNIMLYSMPHYFGLKAISDPFFNGIFLGLSLALSIPLVLYSGREYLESAYKALLKSRAHINIPISLGILSLWVWSIYEIVSGLGHGYLDSLSGLIFFLLVGKWFQSKIYDQVSYQREVEEFIPMLARKLDESGVQVWLKVNELEKGDRIVVKNNEIVPVDAVLLSDEALIDYSFITGEQDPEQVHTLDDIYAGGRQLSGEIVLGIIDKPDENKLWSAWKSESHEKLQSNWTNKVSKYFTLAVLSIAAISGLIWYFIDPSAILFVVSSVLIVACPCALALSAPFTYGNTLRVFSKNQFFIKLADSIFNMSKSTQLVLDKTGTLTERNGRSMEYVGKQLSKHELQLVYSSSKQSNHPLSISIAQNINGLSAISSSNFKEFPGKGIQAYFGEERVKLGSFEWLGVKRETTDSAVAVELNGIYKGYFKLVQAYRNDLGHVLHDLGKEQELSLLSGDNNGEEEALKQVYPDWRFMKFNMNPKDKAEVIDAMNRYEKVAYVGDGINDSLALESSDMGIAITESLNDFYPGSDGVLLADSLPKLPAFFSLAKYTNKILKWSLLLSLIYNICGLAFAVSGQLTPVVAAILMPISSITVVSLDAALVHLKARKLKLI